MAKAQKNGSRILGGIIILLIVLFVVIDYFIRQSSEFSPANVTNILLVSLQIIVLLLALILLFVLARNLIKLYLERKQRLVGSHFKIKLVMFFTALAFLPTLLLFLFSSDLVNRNIEQWFKTPLNQVLDDTKSVADAFKETISSLALHDAQQLSREISRQNLLDPENRTRLEEFVRAKLFEYKLDEIGIYVEEEPLFSYLNPNLPLQDYQNLNLNVIKRAYLGELFSDIEPMGTGQFVRRGVSASIPRIGNALITTGKFLPQNLAQKIDSISVFVQRYRTRTLQKDLTKQQYRMVLIFVTILIVFAAVWIGFHIAKSITVPVEKLAQATKEVSKGNLSVRVEDPASDELGMLIDSFNQMIADLKTGRESIEQKTAEQEARKQYIETILNSVSTGVLAIEADGRIAAVNPAARTILALPEANVVGGTAAEVLGDPRYHDLLSAIEASMRTRHRLAEKEISLLLDGQQTTLALTLTPLKPPGREFAGMIVVLDDLTQLIKAQRIAAWKEVAQRVAHEIKNPLTPIQLNAERIIKNLKRTEPGGAEVVEQGAKVIIQEAQTIKSLIDEFSDFARLPKIHLQPARLNDIVQQVVTMFRGIYSEVQFDVDLSAAVPAEIPLDTEQIKRALINLFDNAIDAMSKKGRIALRTAYDAEAGQVRVEVTDTGPGISVEDKDKLFLPHFSTKKKGTGLGLAIVNQIVKEHNGMIEVQNNRPTGAKFTLRLPA